MIDFKHQVFDIISKLTGHENVITLNVAFVDFVEDLECGLFLSQLIYWSDRGTRKDGYIFKTDKEWYDELRLSKYAVRKSKKKLKEMGLLETKIKKAYGNPTTHYKLNKEEFVKQFIWFLRNQQNESSNSQEGNVVNEQSLTEITTDILNKDYKKNKGQNSVADRVSFSDYKIFLKDQSLAPYQHNQLEALEKFVEYHETYTKREHPNLTIEQWISAHDSMLYVESNGTDHEFEIDDEEQMIHSYFETDYKKECNYSVLHYTSGDLRAVRFYDAVY